MSRSRIAMIDGYDVQRHLAAATSSSKPPAEDIQQMRFDAAKERIAALIPINDALYSALQWYKAQAAVANATIPLVVYLMNAYPVQRMEWEVDQWHTLALKLMEDDSYLYDVAAYDNKFVEFSNVLDRLVKDAAVIGDRLQHTGLLSSTAAFVRRFPKALSQTIRWALDETREFVKDATGFDPKAFLAAAKPFLIGGAILAALVYVGPLLAPRRER